MKIKEMREKRIEAFNNAQKIYNTAAAENRDLNSEEDQLFQDYCAQVEKYDRMISRAEQLQVLNEQPDDVIAALNPDDFASVILPEDIANKKKFIVDVQSFAADFRARALGEKVVKASAQNMGREGNTAIIPTTIADKIVTRVQELSSIYNLATKVSTKGEYKIPLTKTSDDDITVGYATEFVAITAHAAAFDAVTLSDYEFRTLVKISFQLIDATDFELVETIIEQMAYKIAVFENHELIVGTENKSRGLQRSYDSTNMAVALDDKDTLAADDLKSVKFKVPKPYRKFCRYLMNPSTLEYISKLKDGEGRYLFDDDDEKLLGYPVETDDNMPELGTAGATVVYFGDFSGLYAKKAILNRIQILQEKYADEGAIGIIGFGYIDSVVANIQKIAGIKTPAAN